MGRFRESFESVLLLIDTTSVFVVSLLLTSNLPISPRRPFGNCPPVDPGKSLRGWNFRWDSKSKSLTITRENVLPSDLLSYWMHVFYLNVYFLQIK